MGSCLFEFEFYHPLWVLIHVNKRILNFRNDPCLQPLTLSWTSYSQMFKLFGKECKHMHSLKILYLTHSLTQILIGLRMIMHMLPFQFLVLKNAYFIFIFYKFIGMGHSDKFWCHVMNPLSHELKFFGRAHE